MILLRTFFPWWGLYAGEPVVMEIDQVHAPALAEIHAASFHKGWGMDEFESMIADRSIHGHVLQRRENGPVVGFILTRFAVDEGEILSIAVAPALRGRGLSGRLLETHVQGLRRLHLERLFLEVESGNEAALALYRRHGFTEIGRRKGYYKTAAGAADAIMMQRPL